MANVEIDVDTGSFNVSASSAELDYGIIYSYWGWGDGEIIEWGNEEYLFYTRAFSRNWDTIQYDYTPKSTSLERSIQFDITTTPFLISGADVTLSDVNISLDADTTLFEIKATYRFPLLKEVKLLKGYQVNIDTELFSVSESEIELLYSANVDLFADTAAYQVTGSSVDLEIGYAVLAATAAYTVTGTAVTLDKGVTVDADTSIFSISAGAVTFPYTKSINADVSRYQVLGGDITFDVSGGITTFGKFDATNEIKPENVSVKITHEVVPTTVPVSVTGITIPSDETIATKVA